MSRVLLNCAENEAQLKAFVEHELGLDVSIARGDLAMRSALKSGTVSLVIRDSAESIVRDLAFVREVRGWGYVKPILALTEGIGDGLVGAPGVCFVERPLDTDVLKSVARKMLASEVVPQQIFRRHKVNLTARIETFDSGRPFETMMFNLSKGGAYCELGHRPGVRVGDLLRMKVWLNELEREYTLSGRVVWTTPRGRRAGGYGIGLKFVNASDILRQIQS